jgi:tetratricopeptide (TPR) repeat protein
MEESPKNSPREELSPSPDDEGPAAASTPMRRSLPGPWLWLVVVALGAGVGGFLLARVLRPVAGPGGQSVTDAAGGPAEERPVGSSRGTFPEAAFSEHATIDDLKAEAVRVAEGLAGSLPKSAAALGVKARVQFNLGRNAEAVKIWQRCIELDPGAVDAYYGIGLLASDKHNDHKTAAEAFAQVVRLDPAYPRAHALLGQALIGQGKAREAAEALELHVRNRPPSPEAFVTLGQAYLRLEEYGRAKETFETLIKVAANHKKAWFGLATAYRHLGQTDRAQWCLDKFRQLDDEELENFSEELGRFRDHASSGQIVVRTLCEAAREYLRHGRTRKAEETWQRAAALDSSHVECRLALVSLYESHDMNEEALRVSEELRRIDPTNAEYWLNEGLLNARLDRFDAALAALERAAELAPNDSRCREALETLRKGK